MYLKFLLLFIKSNKARTFLLLSIFIILQIFVSFSYFSYKNIESFLGMSINLIDADTKFFISETDALNTKKNTDIETFYQDLQSDEQIANVHTYTRLTVPGSVGVDLFGKSIVTDLFIYLTDKPGLDTYSLSSRALALYNLEIANNFYPKLSLEKFSGLPLEICIGKSMIWDFGGEPKCQKGKIGALDEDAPLFGITVPTSQFSEYKYKGKIVKIVGEVHDSQYISILEQKLQNTSLKLTSQKEQKVILNKKMSLVQYSFALIAGIVVFLSLLFIYYIISTHYFAQKSIYKVLAYDGIKNSTSILLTLNYFLSLLIMASITSGLLLYFSQNKIIMLSNEYFLNLGLSFTLLPIYFGFFCILYSFLFVYLGICIILLFKKT